MEAPQKAREIYRILRALKLLEDTRFTSLEGLREGDIFQALIATILSQNTNDKNSIAAFRELKKNIKLTPYVLANKDLYEIKKWIRKAGLYDSKAKAIRDSAKLVISELEGDLNNLKKYPLKEAKRILLNIKGIGVKTADVILLHMNYPVFPVDTHIMRVSKRLGLVGEEAGYEEVSRTWRKALSPEEYLDAHLRLIAFGRKICLSRKPRCDICPLSHICIYVKKYGKSGEDKR
jgi:endonuclease-3